MVMLLRKLSFDDAIKLVIRNRPQQLKWERKSIKE